MVAKVSSIFRDKTKDNKLMYIPNDKKQNHQLKSFRYLFGTNQSQINKSTLSFGNKTLGTSVIYSPMSPLSMKSVKIAINVIKVSFSKNCRTIEIAILGFVFKEYRSFCGTQGEREHWAF